MTEKKTEQSNKNEMVAQSEVENVETVTEETVSVVNPETGEKTNETQMIDEPNIKFVGKDGRLPEKAFNAGELGRITMPDAEVQREPFYHPKANIIIQISPWYKAVQPKGK